MDRAVRNVDATQDAPDHYGDCAAGDLSSVSCHIKDCRREAPNRLAGWSVGCTEMVEGRKGRN
jgi:hypothetical protein